MSYSVRKYLVRSVLRTDTADLEYRYKSNNKQITFFSGPDRRYQGDSISLNDRPALQIGSSQLVPKVVPDSSKGTLNDDMVLLEYSAAFVALPQAACRTSLHGRLVLYACGRGRGWGRRSDFFFFL